MQPYWQYIVLLGAVVIVGAFVMPRKKQNAAIPKQTIQNMEMALEQFMENLEKDNQELVQLVTQARQDAMADAERKEQRIHDLERSCEALAKQLKQLSVRTMDSVPLVPSPPSQLFQTYTITQSAAEQPAEPAELAEQAEPAEDPVPPSNSIQARYTDLFKLYEQGKSIEAISKKLGLNKGEVQLIIQLAKQEEAAHA